jgi:predicted RNA-binding protein with PIN domain
MALQYFIDGYNVIRSRHWALEGSGADQREALLRVIEEKSPTGSARNEVVVVFDGFATAGDRVSGASLRVMYSGGRDADSVIKNRVDELGSGSQAVVVTDDKAIQRWVRGAKARVMSCDDFLRAGETPAPERRREKPDAATAREINEELKRLWKMK